jgi:Epoxide hydrolase N terminus
MAGSTATGSTAVGEGAAIRPFTVDVPQAELDVLRRRILATRWPEKETVADATQGVQLATIQTLAEYWATEYELRRFEARLNAFPQFITEIDGLDIHFIHVRSPNEHALPVIITHGWPGSIVEMLNVIGPLSDPTAHGGDASDAFDVVIPSMPGYGFSGKPTGTGWGPVHIADAWFVLMKRLGMGTSWRRAGTGELRSPTRWVRRHHRSCWESTPTCPVPSRPPSPKRSR